MAREAHTKITNEWNEFKDLLDQKYILLSPFCGKIECEDLIKNESARETTGEIGTAAMGAKTLCIPLQQVSQFFYYPYCHMFIIHYYI